MRVKCSLALAGSLIFCKSLSSRTTLQPAVLILSVLTVPSPKLIHVFKITNWVKLNNKPHHSEAFQRMVTLKGSVYRIKRWKTLYHSMVLSGSERFKVKIKSVPREKSVKPGPEYLYLACWKLKTNLLEMPVS